MQQVECPSSWSFKFLSEKQLRDLLKKLICFGCVGCLFGGPFGGLLGSGGMSVVALCGDSLGFIRSSLLVHWRSFGGLLFFHRVFLGGKGTLSQTYF